MPQLIGWPPCIAELHRQRKRNRETIQQFDSETRFYFGSNSLSIQYEFNFLFGSGPAPFGSVRFRGKQCEPAYRITLFGELQMNYEICACINQICYGENRYSLIGNAGGIEQH